MAITASISVSQGSSPSDLIITDTTENEATEDLTGRTLTVSDSEGNPFPGYDLEIPFSFEDYPSGVITLTGLTVDLALNVQMDLDIVTPVGGSVYTVSEDVVTNRFSQQGLYNIQVARFLDNTLPAKGGDQARLNSMDIIIEESNSQTAAAYSSLVGAQAALTRAQNIIDNQVL